MAATTTAQLNSIWQHVKRDHPEFIFAETETARWSPDEQTVYHQAITSRDALVDALHELGHGLCRHRDFTQDISLLAMEREAWDMAAQLGERYMTPISPGRIDTALDTYREWLHARSRCPTCSGAGLQAKDDTHYRCLLCDTTWRANDARQCELRRYTTQKTRS